MPIAGGMAGRPGVSEGCRVWVVTTGGGVHKRQVLLVRMTAGHMWKKREGDRGGRHGGCRQTMSDI